MDTWQQPAEAALLVMRWPSEHRLSSVSDGALCCAGQVTSMAKQMVINYGFSDIGPWSLLDQNAQSQDMIMRMMAKNSTSESLQRKIDQAVKKIADEAYTLALKHVR